MKVLQTILLAIGKVLLYWFYVIPFNLTIIAFVGYNVIMYFLYGSLNPTEIREVVEANGFNMVTGFLIPFGIPYIISLFRMFGDGSRRAHSTILEDTIAHRNRMMSHKSDKEAFRILQKTSHLDVMNANKDNPMFNKTVQGFSAKAGNKNPASVYKEFMGE